MEIGIVGLGPGNSAARTRNIGWHDDNLALAQTGLARRAKFDRLARRGEYATVVRDA